MKSVQQSAVLEFHSPDPFAEEEPRVTLFTIDGQEHTVPESFPPVFALKALDVARKQGEEIMMSWILEEALGAESYAALLECRGVTSAQLRGLMESVSERVLGALEETKGN